MRSCRLALAIVSTACGAFAGCGGGGGGDGEHDASVDSGTDAGTEARCDCALGAGPIAPCRDISSATVRQVVDGDTIDVRLDDGAQRRIRLIGIDAPESSEGDCGAGATAYTRSLLPVGASVEIRFDVDCLDRYDRLLGYVFRTGNDGSDDDLVNARIACAGHAQACPVEPNTAYAEALECMATEAAAEGRGGWAVGCNRDGCF